MSTKWTHKYTVFSSNLATACMCLTQDGREPLQTRMSSKLNKNFKRNCAGTKHSDSKLGVLYLREFFFAQMFVYQQ